jgi:hypothetical protein
MIEKCRHIHYTVWDKDFHCHHILASGWFDIFKVMRETGTKFWNIRRIYR